MSFILDAIARSERERQQQQTPDARSLAFPAAAPVRSRSKAPFVLGGLLLAIAILAAIWMQSPRPLVTPVGGSGGSVMPAAPEAAGQPRQAPAESGDAPPTAPAETPRPNAATPMLADATADETVARVQSSTVEAPVAEPTTDNATTSSPVERLPAAAANAPQDDTVAADSRLAGLASDPPVAATEAAPPASEAPRRRVSRLSDLPADVRRVLPSVVFTGHLYSKNPRASYVFIDGGRQVVAGQQITDDLTLDEITPTGVVVEFQGYLIEVGVLQNWSLK